MNNRTLFAGAGLGAALAFIFDSGAGRRRRALAGEKVAWTVHKARTGLETTVRDVTDRARGLAAATWARLSPRIADDATVVERVRARLGRVVSHPHAVDVSARDGGVTLRGPILADEVDTVIDAILRVPGVGAVLNQLTPLRSVDNLALSHGRDGGRESGIPLESQWASTTRALVGATVVVSWIVVITHARSRSL